jgi:hypothetical protein
MMLRHPWLLTKVRSVHTNVEWNYDCTRWYCRCPEAHIIEENTMSAELEHPCDNYSQPICRSLFYLVAVLYRFLQLTIVGFAQVLMNHISLRDQC